MARKKRKKAVLPDGVRMIVRNKRAYHDYDISERLEAGIVLVGSEVKSLRDQRASIGEGHIEIRNGEAWLVGVQINEYKWSNNFNHDPMRRRKLLLHKRQISKLDIKISQRGFTLVPLSIYLKDGRIKVEIGLARGKRQYEKRQSKREADDKREIARAIKTR